MTDFQTCVLRVLAHEGGYVDNPSDPGGATNYGITERVARENGYTGPMQDLSRTLAEAIYKRLYWATVHADELPAGIRFQVFDAAVNHGPARAVQWLQSAVGTKPDGIIGPLTLAAAAKMGGAATGLRFNAQRLAFYASLPTWPTFGKGWARRVAQNLDYAAGDSA
jgi:lysozyme family protein